MTLPDIRSKYEESFEFLQQRKRRQVSQLVLLNNLNRGDQNIASTLLITLFNRIMSSLYDDKMQVKFLPSQGILQEQLNSYNILAQSDYLEMEKAKIDYDWTWDALFFGQGYLETLRFNKKRKIMEPTVINPLAFGYDPYFDNVQDWRYYWKWVTKNRSELKKLIKAGVIKTKIEDIPSGVDSYLWDYKIKRDEAKKGTAMATDTKSGDVYQILEFYGYDEKTGNKTVWWIDKMFSKELFKQKLDLQDGEQIVAPNGDTIDTGSKWPIVVKQAFREPHSSIQFSIADLLEDKHRAKSVLLNLAYIAAKDRANPLYVYNPDKVTDVTQLFNRQIAQHIPVTDVVDAVAPLNKDNPMDAGLLNFISLLTTEANEPMGTGTVAQPEARKLSNTATEAAIDQQLNDMAQSLQSKVLQFGESEFWSHWFHRYKRYGKEFGSKMANIVGVKGVKTEEVEMSDFETDFPPGVLVYSAKEAEYKELVLRRDLINLYPQLATTLGPDGMRNFNKHIFFPKFLQDPSLIDVMFPETLDEMKATEENEMLKENEYPSVSESDDHLTHIYIHQMVQPKTLATWFHIAEHQDYTAKAKHDMMVSSGMLGQQSQQPQTPTNQPINKQRLSPMEAASPLKQEMQTPINQ